MKITGYIKGNEIIGSSDTTEFISELLKNREYIDFHDKSELFDLIVKTLENQTVEINLLKTQIKEINETVGFHKIISGKYFRYFEFLIIFLTFTILILKL